METTITYLELLQMIKEGKQPKTITTKVDGENHKYTYGGGSYADKNGRSLKDDWAFRYYSPYGHANEAFIHYEDKILDDAEKRYLKGVIRPFRNSVKYIEKLSGGLSTSEYIRITFVNHEFMSFPAFPIKRMYAGMEIGRCYTLEDLEL